MGAKHLGMMQQAIRRDKVQPAGTREMNDGTFNQIERLKQMRDRGQSSTKKEG